jgi:hypothetical protein
LVTPTDKTSQKYIFSNNLKDKLRKTFVLHNQTNKNKKELEKID